MNFMYEEISCLVRSHRHKLYILYSEFETMLVPIFNEQTSWNGMSLPYK